MRPRARARARNWAAALGTLLVTGGGASRADTPAVPAAPITLARALAVAGRSSPELARRRAAIDAAEARVVRAWAEFAPGIGLRAAYVPQTGNYVPTPSFRRGLAQRGDPAASSRPPVSYRLYDFYTAGAEVNWSVFSWGRSALAVDAERAARSATEAELEAARRRLELDIKVVYAHGLAAQDAIGVAEAAIANRKEHLKRAEELKRQGAGSRVEVAFAEAQLALAQVAGARATALLEAARGELAAALGASEVKPYAYVRPKDATDERASTALPQTRPEVEALRLRADAADATRRAAGRRFFPELLLRAGADVAGDTPSDLTPNLYFMVELRYLGTLGMNPLETWAVTREADANARAAREDERAAVAMAAREVAAARAELAAAETARAAAARAIDAAELSRDTADQRYRTGAAPLVELSDAEYAVVAAKNGLVTAQLEVDVGRARLEHARGR